MSVENASDTGSLPSSIATLAFNTLHTCSSNVSKTDVRGVRVSRGGRGRVQGVGTGRQHRTWRVVTTDVERGVWRHRRPRTEAGSQTVPARTGGRHREGSDPRFGG